MIKNTNVELSDAWKKLGVNPITVITSIASLPRSERIEATERYLLDAKKRSKFLLAKHHPDRGGDHNKFVEINKAIRTIEEHTEQFKKKMEHLLSHSTEQEENKIVIVKILNRQQISPCKSYPQYSLDLDSLPAKQM